MLQNTQSIKNKEDSLTDYLRNEAIDMGIATQTCLTNHDRDVIWMELNGFMKDGELALTYRSNITVTNMDQKQYRYL